MDRISYTGEALQVKDEVSKIDAYIPSKELVEAVNLAILLKQPLLLMGEPGCGKTRLAEAVAAELHGKHIHHHYFQWNVKSTSKAKEGIYHYDALKRMYDAHAGNNEAKEVKNYISKGKFAQALTLPQNGDRPNVLLIDEIDKADIDFPNDLLLEIEKKTFEIPELDQKLEQKSNVLIFITSNRERELPPAFLRRCIYYYINFPCQDDLIRILSAQFSNSSNSLLENAVHLFLDIRAKIESYFGENDKKPSTSELLEWFRVIQHWSKQRSIPEGISIHLDVIRNYEKGTIDNIPIPFSHVLLKTWESTQLFKLKK